ncbi:MAG: T9SS C-terminal target domain-containing protein [Flavobacteriia bacterium]|nr:T9SS C-terminal target domain-containing protein [Flavobacteriia bacterium]
MAAFGQKNTKPYVMKLLVKIALFVLTLGISFNANAQQRGYWFNLEDLSILSQPEWIGIQTKLQINNLQQALPASKKASLRKVYALDCECTAEDLKAAFEPLKGKVTFLSEAPNYQPLYAPNDFNNNVQVYDYALSMINAPQAWDLTHGDDSIVIAISDQNFYVQHEDLEGKIIHYDPSNTTTATHGTAVAITAAGNTDNGVGLSSIGFNSSLALYKMNLNEVLQASYDGAHIINISWTTGCFYNQIEQDVMDEVAANGSFIIASAGNGNTCGDPNAKVYPASYNHVFSVTSVGSQNNHEYIIGDSTSTHQHNDSVDLSAPGFDVAISPAPGWYLNLSGSSFAAAYVSGTAALMLAANKCISNVQIEAILKSTSFNLDILNPQYAGKMGAGRLDAHQAVLAAINVQNVLQPTFSLLDGCQANDAEINLIVQGGQSPYTATWSNGYVGFTNSALNSNTYHVNLTDVHGCRLDTFIYVNDAIPPTFNQMLVNPTCADASNGGVQLNLTNNTPVNILWSNGQVGTQLSNLAQGMYEATLLYGINCQITTPFVLTAPDPIQISGTTLPQTNNSLGEIDASVIGGTAPYIYAWDNNVFSEDLDSVAFGTYVVTVTDANGCQQVEAFEVDNQINNAGVSEAEQPAVLLYPNPTHGNFQIQVPEGMKYLVRVFDLQGRLTDQFEVIGSTSINQNYAPGKYICVLEEELTKHKIDLTLIVY